MAVTNMARALVYLKRITLALERLAPPPRRRLRRTEFSVATDADFERGYDTRNVEELDGSLR